VEAGDIDHDKMECPLGVGETLELRLTSFLTVSERLHLLLYPLLSTSQWVTVVVVAELARFVECYVMVYLVRYVTL
jgi:hypothetical protein